MICDEVLGRAAADRTIARYGAGGDEAMQKCFFKFVNGGGFIGKCAVVGP